MFLFEVNEASLERVATRFKSRIKGNITESLDKMRVEFQDWLRIEQQRGTNGGWPALSTTYEKEKERNFPGQPILTRTGTMMAGYISGIRTVPFDAKVIIEFPGTDGSPVNTRAKAHQGVIARPKGVPIRHYPVDQQGYEHIKLIAIRNFTNAIRKSLHE